MAVSENCGQLTIYEGPPDNLGASSLAPVKDGQRSFSVPAVSVDNYCLTCKVLPDLMKIDVEGAEISVLRGASQMLREKHPTLLVEVAEVNLRQFGFTSDELIRELKGFGYSLSRIEDNEPAFYNILASVPGSVSISRSSDAM
jgi:Methyltransferase FkbM domain